MPLARTPNMLVVVDDHPNSEAGLTIAHRYAQEHVTLASWDRQRTERSAETLTSTAPEPTISEALTTAAARDISWVAMRRDCLPPQQLLAALLRAAAENRDAQQAGFGVILAEGEPQPFRRILAIVDRGSSQVSGLGAYFAVAVAIRAGASLDILVVGAPEDPELDPEANVELLDVNREEELFQRARDMARESGLEHTYLTASDDPWTTISDALATGQYDLVVDDLGDVSLGRNRRGLEPTIGSALELGEVGNLPLRLLTETSVPLMLVMDNVRLGFASPGLLRLGTAAAVTLGIAGSAIIPSSGAAAALNLGPNAEPVDQLISDLQGGLDLTTRDAPAKDAPAKDRKTTVQQASRSTQKVKVPKGGASPKEVAKAKSKAAKSKAKLTTAKEQKEAAAKAVAKAEKKLAKAEKQAAAAAVAVESTRETKDATQQQAEEATSSSSGLSAILPGGANDEDVAVITELSSEAEDEFLEAVNEGGEALKELTEAQLGLDDATFRLDSASTDLKKAKDSYAGSKATADAYAKSLSASKVTPVAKGQYRLTARFGQAGGLWSSGHHTGLDFAAPTGTNVRAASSGTVVSVGYSGAYGNRVVIKHANGYETAYNHLSKTSVSKGQKVSAGESVGKVGSTGNSTGAHLHFEVTRNGKFIDPQAWLG